MQLIVPAVGFSVSVDGQSVTIADTPRLRFQLTNLKVDPTTGDLQAIELPEPLYDHVEDLMDQPITALRLPRPLPAYPSDLRSAVGAWIFSSSDLALDIWLQTSRAYISHLCPPSTKPGPASVKPLYQFEIGVGLRFKVKADKEIWTRSPVSDRTPNVLGPWKKDSVEPGEWNERQEGVTWGDHITANELIPTTPCIPLPPDAPLNTWQITAHRIMRTITLPYYPGLPTPSAPQA